VGFTIEDHFVVGMGLDLDGKHRNLPFVGVFRPEGGE
jgi:hypoxanthine phosphoribosyltransferase